MEKKPSPLPPLQTLRAFESAARLASFTRAAAEMNVTQGAVSRQIRNLEQRLGVDLFRRAERGIALTAAGRRYHETVRDALQRIAVATADLAPRGRHGPVTIGASSALASLWLMPRLAAFRRRDPDLAIRVLASDQDLPDDGGELDLLIRYARERPPGEDVRFLFDESVFPVCAPDYLAARETPPGGGALLDETLLVLDDDHPDWIGWDAWFASAGIAPATPARSIRINSYPMVLQAAVAGQGIALGWQHLVDDLLAAGTLVALPATPMPNTGAFYLDALRPLPADSPAGRLQAWLVEGA